MRLDLYDNSWFERGKPAWVESLWLVVQALFVQSWIPGAKHRKALLRQFGAQIGKGVDIKPGARIKFPWRLKIGDYSWIGEDVWIDNLAPITIGDHCCISQGVYLCTGNHNWKSERFDLITEPIEIKDKVWMGARSMVGPGVTVNEGAVLTLGSVATHDLKAGWIHQGVPAGAIRKRSIE
ncbi:WcaF family extracellular polysaccharide biosynthesis acetyltransferase [Thermodesulfobacteriota bacterium]